VDQIHPSRHDAGREYGIYCYPLLPRVLVDWPQRTSVQSQPKNASLSGSLREMSPAGTNSRSGILPPGSIANKTTTGSALPSRSCRWFGWTELTTPELNRSRSTTQAPETRSVGSGTGTTSRLASGTTRTHGRTHSHATSTRTASRTTNGYSSATIGPGQRPASSIGMTRPHSSAARRQNGPTSRPASSLDTHEEEPGGSMWNRRNGMQQFHFLPSRSITPIDGPPLCNGVSRMSPSPLPDSPLEYPEQQTQDGFAKPLVSKVPLPTTPAKSNMGPPPSVPSRSSSKRNPSHAMPFLTKDSTTRLFNSSTGAAWDQDSRERGMEDIMNKFMSSINQAGQESYGLKEAVELYKSRGKPTQALTELR
jgi:hypothetical protein